MRGPEWDAERPGRFLNPRPAPPLPLWRMYRWRPWGPRWLMLCVALWAGVIMLIWGVPAWIALGRWELTAGGAVVLVVVGAQMWRVTR